MSTEEHYARAEIQEERRQQISEMPAGEEMDRAVGLAIGWTIRKEHGYGFQHESWVNSSGRRVADADGHESFIPSVYIRDAMRAADLFCRDGFAIHRPHASQCEADELWHCVVGLGWDGSRAVQVIETRAATAELAICRAILMLKAAQQCSTESQTG